MKKILTHPFTLYTVSFIMLFSYALYINHSNFKEEWLWGVALFAVPIMLPVAFIMEGITTLLER